MAVGTNSKPEVSILERCLERLALRQIGVLGGRVNQHWLVEGAEGRLVLRAYSAGQLDNVGYEVEVLRRLHQAGWPVPQVVREPIREGGRFWCLFTVLPGSSILTNSPSEQRLRGQLLGQLHQSTASFVDMGQRNGFRTADEIVSSPTLRRAIGNYERLRPSTAHVLRWHLDKAAEMFEQAEPAKADLVVWG